MKHLDTYKKYNEGIGKSLLTAGLATGLALSSPAQSYKNIQDGVIVNNNKINYVNKISILRKEYCKDDSLSMILDEIKNNVGSRDTAKFISLYNKLSEHLQGEYGYKFENRNINELNKDKIEELKVDKSEFGLFVILGWLGSICLAICGIPQAWMSYKEKHSEGISWAFLLLWAFGELFALAYVYDKLDLPLLLNYSVNILILAVILYFKVRPSNTVDFKE